MQDVGESSWGAADVVSQLPSDGHIDAGEAAAFRAVSAQRRGAVLDLGIGSGRTTAFLRPGSHSYVGVDLSPEMIRLARQRFAGVDLRVGNARDLEGLPDHAFDLVFFSFNGLDALDHEGRLESLAAMARVLAPGGRLVFSSLNLDGVSFDERPWSLPQLTSSRARYHLLHAARHPLSVVRSVQNYQRNKKLSEDGPGWGRRPLRAHEFRFVVHFATLAETVAEVRAAGLEVVAAYADTGDAVDVTAERTTADYVHFLCATVGPS